MYNCSKTADKIRICCIKMGISVKQLEEMTNIGNPVAKVRAGSITNISHFCKMADALGVSLDELVDNSNPTEI